MNKSKSSSIRTAKQGHQFVHHKPQLIERANQLTLQSREKYLAALAILNSLPENQDDPLFKKRLSDAKKLESEGEQLLKEARILRQPKK